MDTNRFVVGADEPLEGTVCGSPGAENDGRIGLLRTPFRCAIRPIIAQRNPSVDDTDFPWKRPRFKTPKKPYPIVLRNRHRGYKYEL